MKIRKILALCLSVLLITAAGCSALRGEKAASFGIRSESSPSLTSQIPSFSSAIASSDGNANSKRKASESAFSAAQAVSKAESKKIQNDSDWVAYTTNKDHYKLHIKKADGSEDKVIVNDTVFAPCVAGEWVYYFADLSTIEKVKLDGSQKTKVCNTDGVQVYDTDINAYHGLSGSTAFTGEYRDEYILYRFFQMKQAGDENKEPNPPSYYKLDLKQNKLIPVNN